MTFFEASEALEKEEYVIRRAAWDEGVFVKAYSCGYIDFVYRSVGASREYFNISDFSASDWEVHHESGV